MFGAKGVLVFDELGVNGRILSVKVMANGKVVLLAGFNTNMVRLNEDGSFDQGFAGDGLTPTSIHAGDLVVQGSKLLLVGSVGTFDSDFALERRTSSGALDTTFGNAGWVSTGTSAEADYGYAVALTSSGKILVAGEGYKGGIASALQFNLVRYSSTGVLDTTFGRSGIAHFSVNDQGDYFTGMVVQGSGRIVLAGSGPRGGNWGTYVELVGVTPEGKLDTGFGSGGEVITSFAGAVGAAASQVLLQADGKIVVVGSVQTAMDNYDFLVLRYTQNGALDPTFANGGVFMLDVDGGDVANCAAIQLDGKIVVAGGTDATLALFRLNTDGSRDMGFGTAGLTRTQLGSYETATDMALQQDGKILVATESDNQPALVRYNTDGSLDTSIDGTQGDDVLSSTARADDLLGFGGDDIITGGGGNDNVDGGDGQDYAIFSGSRAGYTVLVANSIITVTDQTAGRDGVDTLSGVERLEFADGYLAFDTAGTAGQAYRLYQAAFNRTPDVAGLGYQLNALDEGLALPEVAKNFIDSPEFSATYSALDDAHFVTQLYMNALHRGPEEAGLAYHVARLSAGASRADVLVGFSESPENQAALIGAIQNGMFYTL